MNISIRKILFVTLICACAAAYCDKGDVFLFGSLMTDPVKSSGPAFGGEAGLQIGANDRTDFQISANVDATPGYSDTKGVINARYLFTSYFTPYFGDIRPKLGGSVGLVQVVSHGGVSNAFFNAGANLQGLITLNSNVLLYGEVNPNFTLGGGGDFSTLVKLGILFRLSK